MLLTTFILDLLMLFVVGFDPALISPSVAVTISFLGGLFGGVIAIALGRK